MSRKIITNHETVEALQELHKQKDGLLKPLDVVESARQEGSPLHKYFEWDDSAAAQKYRIEQARNLLQIVSVKIIQGDESSMQQVFVSLSSDRRDGGYRMLIDVLQDKDLRNQLVRDALADMQAFTNRYREFEQLSSVFAEMQKAKEKLVKSA